VESLERDIDLDWLKARDLENFTAHVSALIEIDLLGLDEPAGERGTRHPTPWDEILAQEFPEGQGYNTMVQLVGRWIGKGLIPAEVGITTHGVNRLWRSP
jgi:hypothetical protein